MSISGQFQDATSFPADRDRSNSFEIINAFDIPDDNCQMDKGQSGSDDDSVVVVSKSDLYLEDDSETEPFPDYYGNCEESAQNIDRQVEASYNFAMPKVSEAATKFMLETDSELDGFYPSEFNNRSSSNPETYVLNDIQTLTWHPGIDSAICDHFRFMINMVLRVNHALSYLREYFPETNSLEGIDRATDVSRIASKIEKQIVDIHERAKNDTLAAENTESMLRNLSKASMADPALLYERMVKIAARNLRKPPIVESMFVKKLLKLYEVYVFEPYANVYLSWIGVNNRDKVDVNPAFKAMHSCVIKLQKLLNECVSNSESYITSLNRCKTQYIQPVMLRLGKVPRFARDELLDKPIGEYWTARGGDLMCIWGW